MNASTAFVFSVVYRSLLIHAPTTSSHSVNSPLTIHNSLSPSLPSQDQPLSQIFFTIDSVPASGLTSQTLLLDRFFWASRFLFFVCSLLFIIVKKTSQFKRFVRTTVAGYVTQIKQQKSKRWYYLAAHRRKRNVLTSNVTFLIFYRQHRGNVFFIYALEWNNTTSIRRTSTTFQKVLRLHFSGVAGKYITT